MENYEIVNDYENETFDNTSLVEEDSSMSPGVAMLIGVGLTIAVGAAVKLGKWAYDTIKAKRELAKREDDYVDVVD